MPISRSPCAELIKVRWGWRIRTQRAHERRRMSWRWFLTKRGASAAAHRWAVAAHCREQRDSDRQCDFGTS